MKKFLTVLLALSVVFTYTVGTAFAALPSDDGTQAGLANAKAEAVKELEAYPTMSDYDATGQAKIKAYIADYTDKINDATAVGKKTDTATDKTVYGYLNAGKKAIDGVSTLNELKAAIKAALDQFNDYVYLIDNSATLNMSITADVMKAANVGYNDYATFKTKSIAAINAAVDVEAVESVLNTAIEKADKIYAQLEEIEVPQSDIDNLVKDIRAKAASYNVNTKTHSSAVVNAYETAIEEGVAAAKAVKTWGDYYAVYDKYLGCTTTSVKAAHNGVYVHISQKSVFEILKNKTLEVEADIKAVEKLLANLGDYDWKEYVDAVNFNDAPKWDDIEEFYYQANYFVENGAFDGALSTATAPAALNTMIKTVKASSNTNAVNGAVSAAEAAIKGLTVLEGYKNSLINDITSYYGTNLKPLGNPTASTAAADYGDNYSYLQAVQTRAANAISLATSIEAADAVYADYVERIDDIKTVKEADLDKYIEKYNAAVDQYVADNSAANMSADAQILLDRVVKDLKAKFVSDQRLRNFDTTNEAEKVLVNAVKGAAYTSTAATNTYGYSFVPLTKTDYYTENYGKAQAVVSGFNATLKGTEAVKITSWADFFAAYDDAEARIDAIPTKIQEDYVEAIKTADAAIDALGTPALTTTFKSTLTKADTAFANYEAKASAFFALPADEQAEVTASLAGGTKYADTKHEYNRLVYLDGQQEGSTTIKEVQDFVKVAGGFLATNIQNYYDKDGKLQIATIIDDTYKAIDAAATTEAKAAAAVEGLSLIHI